MSPNLSSTSLQFVFTCPLLAGMHARPASHFATLANSFISECTLTNLRNKNEGNAKSVLSIISLDIRQGDNCLVQINGADEQFGYTSLRNFTEHVLPTCDVPLAKSAATKPFSLPRILQQAGVACYSGSAASPGVGRGKVVFLNSVSLSHAAISHDATDPKEELQRLKRALRNVRDNIREELTCSGSQARDVLQAELALLDDVLFAERLTHQVNNGKSAAQAVLETGRFFADLLRHSDSEYIRERAADVEEIAAHLLSAICGKDLPKTVITLHEPSVVVADTLAPRQFLKLDRHFLKGIVLEYAGANSHALILARSYGVPAVVGIKHTKSLLSTGQEIVVDANRGLLFPELLLAVERFYAREVRTLSRQTEILKASARSPAITRDGINLDVGANASAQDEAVLAFGNGADGIGLFRTEMLFMEARPPSEKEQVAVYEQVLKAASGKAVIIRTFDLGGDKAVPYLELAPEENPFLGLRGVRLYATQRDLLQVQLRAILRASVFGDVHILIPMVSCLEEVLAFKQQLKAAKEDLRSQNTVFREDIPIGIMLEVPAAAFSLDQLRNEVDFFSVGTNDLAQYFFAADRGNPNVSKISNQSSPSFIRLLKRIVDEVGAADKWVGICGDMASDAKYLPLFLGLGLDEISLPVVNIPKIKSMVRTYSAAACRSLVDEMLLSSDADINHLLASAEQTCSSHPLLSEELMILDSDSNNKEEAMQECIDLLRNAGRTSDPEKLEEALWSRELVYSTGLGFGFATPHCKTDAINASSIVVLKFTQSIDWGAVDALGVRMVIGMAARGAQNGGNHMQVFSVLARKLMTDDFRKQLLAIDDSATLLSYLSEQLNLGLK
ncbi:MAG TPA: phosphoenolpyruvate--protein phosphotransferase [Terriglobales bacterium]|nr:phosphoenolpyruvate--protein phosphotransferase [Terriglobales bacterium]